MEYRTGQGMSFLAKMLFQEKSCSAKEEIIIPYGSISQWLPADFTQEQIQELIVRLVWEWAVE